MTNRYEHDTSEKKPSFMARCSLALIILLVLACVSYVLVRSIDPPRLVTTDRVDGIAAEVVEMRERFVKLENRVSLLEKENHLLKINLALALDSRQRVRH